MYRSNLTISETKQAKKPNAIHAYVLICKKKNISDALDIIDVADEYDYQFIDNPQSQRMLNFVPSLSKLEEALEKDQPTTIYLKFDNFIMKLIFNGATHIIIPFRTF